SPGTKGLHPVARTLRGMSGSESVTVPNGNAALNVADAKRGSPYVFPDAPRPVPGLPKIFQLGTGPSRTSAGGLFPRTGTAEKMAGSLKGAGRCRSDTWESAPVPSRQIIPDPIPPRGKATRFKWGPEYSPLYRL